MRNKSAIIAWFDMTTGQATQVSIIGLIANLAIGATTLAYVRETEHRLTYLEQRLIEHDCHRYPERCNKQIPGKNAP